MALAFSLAGIVAAVRFRVALEDSRDAVFVFAVMALGLACGVQLEIAAVLSVLFVTIVLILWYSDFARTPPSLEGERAAKHFARARLAFDDGEFNAEVRCVAVPVYNFTGEVIGALGISGPIWRMTDQVLQSRAKLVQAAATRLSAEFGARDLTKSS